jgi:hypothetical protein
MKLPLIPRLSAWLCLALALLSWLAPAQGFVVCIEDDGCVSIEIKVAVGDCAGCEGHDEGDTPIPLAGTPSDVAPCPCVDFAVPGSAQDLLAKYRFGEFQIGVWLAALPETRLQSAPSALSAGRAPPACVPRVAVSLAHIRSVVLLV